jgi:hypothetical protein
MFWDESTDALTFGFSDSGPTATTLTPNTTKTLNSYFVGNVGIGTASPATKLNMKGGVFLAENQASTNNQILYGDGGGSGASNNSYNRNSPKFGVGIFVNDTGTTGSTITLMNKEGANNITKHASIGFVNTDTAETGKFGGQIGFWPEDANAQKQQFRIYTSGAQAGYNLPVQRMVVNGDGNVGIGAVSPAHKLEVIGNSYLSGNFISTHANFPSTFGVFSGNHAALDWYDTFLTKSLIRTGNSTFTAKSDGSNRGFTAIDLQFRNICFYAHTGPNQTSDLAITDITTYERMRITPTGNVGIGTNSPSYKLQIKSSENQLFLQTGNDVYGTIISSKDEGNGVVPFQIKTMSNGVVNTRVTINNGNGNVGIGTNNPGVKLQVGGNAETTPQYIRIRGHKVNAAGDICGIQMYNSANSGDRGNSSIINARGGNNYGSELQFWTNPDSNAPASEKVRITAYGNLQMVGPQHAPFQKMTPTVATNDYSFIINAPLPGTSSGGATHFINGSARTTDGGASCYTIRNDNGPLRLGHSSYEVKIPGVVDMGSALKRNQIFSNSVSMTSGQWHDIGNFGGYGHGVFVIHVAWGTTSPYWFGGAACVARIHDGTGSYYTWAPEETLQTNQWYHHRAANRLEFRLKSNGSSGNYGVAKLQILGYANITLPGVSVEITRLMAF